MSLPEHLGVGIHGIAELLDRLREAGSGHSLSVPMEFGGRFWVVCHGCGFIESVDRIEDARTACPIGEELRVSQIAIDLVETSCRSHIARWQDVAARERNELTKLVRPARTA